MNHIWLGLITIAFLVLTGFIVSFLIELKKTTIAVREFLKTTETVIKPALEELQQTMKSLRNTTDKVNDIADDLQDVSHALRDTGQTIKQVSTVIGGITSATCIKVSGLRAGIRTALELLLHSFIQRKGGTQ
jgi:uncharacterized protein YoxC